MSLPRSSAYPVPSAWDTTSRNANTRHLQVSGLRVKYTGPGTEDKDAASVRSNHPVPPDYGLYYYEVEIVAKGRDGFIGIGFSSASVKLDRLPGWESHSYGYHGDDGHKFCGSGMGTAYGPTYSTGDVIGVLYNRAERTISYTKNGIDLGVAFIDVTEQHLYPTVGMRTPEEEVLVNLSGPFKGDVEALAADASAKVVKQVAAQPLPAKGKVSNLLGELIFQALLHNGQWRTAAVVARDILGGAVQVSAGQQEELRTRQAIGAALLAGQVDAATEMTERLAPGCMEANPKLAFRLQCQRFMEMVASGHVEDALLFGRTSLSAEAALSMQDREYLEDVVSLIAYQDPAASPAGYLLQQPHKLELAAQLNTAILRHQGQPEVSGLELAWRQLLAVTAELRKANDPAAALLDIDKLLNRQ